MNSDPCEIWFYHLERSDLDQVLSELLEKALARGWRALVKGESPEEMADLDVKLWTYRDDTFLPHGRANEAFFDRQPILLSEDGVNHNGAKALFAVSGDPGDLSGYERCVIIFDGRSDDALASARAAWTRYKRAGHPVTYWRQGENRGWSRQT